VGGTVDWTGIIEGCWLNDIDAPENKYGSRAQTVTHWQEVKNADSDVGLP